MSAVYLRGVEMPLPEGERVLWQGAPALAELLLHAFHARKVVIYFALLVALAAILAGESPAPLHTFLTAAMWLSISAVVACCFLFVFATLAARTTLYAITERRVVMKIGIALPVVLNVPLAIIDSVNLKPRAHDRGDIALQLAGDSRVAYLVLWPHARAWHLRHPQPLMRGVENAAGVGAVLQGALLAQLHAATAVEQQESSSDAIAASAPAAQVGSALPASNERELVSAVSTSEAAA
ncbi:MAG: photosynthetic complex putative assembly protein PuhB [Gemmatimonadota bacterium]